MHVLLNFEACFLGSAKLLLSLCEQLPAKESIQQRLCVSGARRKLKQPATEAVQERLLNHGCQLGSTQLRQASSFLSLELHQASLLQGLQRRIGQPSGSSCASCTRLPKLSHYDTPRFEEGVGVRMQAFAQERSILLQSGVAVPKPSSRQGGLLTARVSVSGRERKAT